MKNIFDKVLKKMAEFEQKNRYSPKKVYFTHEEEYEIVKLKAIDIGGSLASEIARNGVRKALEEKGKSMFMGLEIKWDADEFKVE